MTAWLKGEEPPKGIPYPRAKLSLERRCAKTAKDASLIPLGYYPGAGEDDDDLKSVKGEIGQIELQ